MQCVYFYSSHKQFNEEQAMEFKARPKPHPVEGGVPEAFLQKNERLTLIGEGG